MRLLDSLRRAFRWRRRTFAALLAAVAVLAALNVLSARGSSGVPVLLAARPIAAGATLTAADLAVGTMPPELTAEGALANPEDLIGRTVVVPVPARGLLTTSILLGSETQVAPGRLALPVRFGQASSVSLLRVGSHIDVLGPTAGGSSIGTVAADVRVVALPAAANTTLGASESPVVLLDVTSAQAEATVAAAAASSLSFALR